MLRYKTETRPGLVACTTSGQKMEQVHSYNPGACTGHLILKSTETEAKVWPHAKEGQERHCLHTIMGEYQ